MERLTYDFCIDGNHCWQVKGSDNLECREVCERQGDAGCKTCPIAKAFDRLAAIEDILGDDYDLSCIRDLVQADRDGRCVVLSEPMSPMVQIPSDTDVYCPNCAQNLSGGWPLSDAGDYRKMCQCPHCGQSIDDTKCEFSGEALKGEKHG